MTDPSLFSPLKTCSTTAAEVAFPTASPDGAAATAEHDAARAHVEQVFQSQVKAMLDKSPLPIATILACQTQLLHDIFVHAARKCSKDPTRFGNMALKSQQYCRLTLEALVNFQVEGKLRESHKQRNELLRSPAHAPLVRPRETASEFVDPWVEAVEEKLWR